MKTKSSSPQRTRHIPQRTCLGCQQIRAKREMVRIMKTPEGNLEVDTTGRKAGRGAYFCPKAECWEAGLKGNRLDHALRSSLSRDVRMQLTKYAAEYMRGEGSASSEKTG